MSNASAPSWAVFVIGTMVIGVIGAFALIYPNTPTGQMALGALLPLAGGIGTYFFHTASQGFLGAQLEAQRTAFGRSGALTSSTPSTSGSSATPAAGGPSAVPAVSAWTNEPPPAEAR